MATRIVTVVHEVQPRYQLRIAFAVIGAFVGFSVAACLGGYYRNTSTAAFAALSGILAVACLILHMKARRGTLCTMEPSLLSILTAVGAVFGAIGVAGIVTFIAVGIHLGQHLHADHDGYFLTSIWCFMTAKWGIALMLYSRQYLRMFFSASSPETESLIQQ